MKLTLVNLSKKFVSLRGSTLAVDNVTLEVEDRELFVLLGPSGCGKSTILNLIAGLEKPTAGEIWFDDRRVASAEEGLSIPPRERNAAMVFQNYALYPHMSVYDNIAFPLRIARQKKGTIDESVAKAASALEIKELLRAKPAELSGGQRQRVAIARAIVREPNIFLLDEPLSNLDAQLRLSTRAELKNLQRQLKITTVYVTHDQIEAMTLGDRIAVLRNGKLEQVATPDQLYAKPANPFVATFVGSPPMNLFEASLIQESGEYFLKIGNSKLDAPDQIVSRIQRFGDKSFMLGIRPEDIKLNRDIQPKVLTGRLESIEPLGREQLLHISAGETRLTALAADFKIKINDIVYLAFDPGRIHLFENPLT